MKDKEKKVNMIYQTSFDLCKDIVDSKSAVFG